MIQIVSLTSSNRAQWQKQLEIFERKFIYPMGEEGFFTIDHGEDYLAFFSHLGQSHTFIAVKGENVIGCVSAALRRLFWQEKIYRVVYLGDLKVDPCYQKNRIYYLLAKALESHVKDQGDFGYGVVMGGTSVTPAMYTGRLDIPLFQKSSEQVILKFSIQPTNYSPLVMAIEESQAKLWFTQFFPNQGWWIEEDYPSISRHPPAWYYDQEGALGRLEDTLLGKRIHMTTGEELLFSHLSYFSFTNPQAGRNLLCYGLAVAHKNQMNGLFTAITKDQYALLKGHIDDLTFDVIPSEIYLTHPHYSPLLMINTSEI